MLDERRLAALIADRTHADICRIDRLELLRGGAIQQNWALDLELLGGDRPGAHQLVLRTDAPSHIAVSHGRMEEFAILRVAFQAGVTVPEPWFACDDRSVDERSFYLMARCPGEARGHRLTRDPTVLAKGAAIVGRLGKELALLHRIRPPCADLSFLSVPDRPVALQRIAEYRAHLDSLGRAEPVLEWALRQLELKAPTSGKLVLCHEDLRTGNYLVDRGELSAILDWEFAAWSDPMEDIGWMLSRPWRFANSQLEAGGIGSGDDFLAGYEAVAGRPVDRAWLPYWQALAIARWAIIALMQADRHLSGQERSLELALTGHVLPELDAALLKAIPRL